MTPATTLTRAIEAAQSDPHGGKVMLTVKEAQAVLADVERLREALGRVKVWRKECHEYDADNGHELRDFDVEDLRMMEFLARAALGADHD